MAVPHLDSAVQYSRDEQVHGGLRKTVTEEEPKPAVR